MWKSILYILYIWRTTIQYGQPILFQLKTTDHWWSLVKVSSKTGQNFIIELKSGTTITDHQFCSVCFKTPLKLERGNAFIVFCTRYPTEEVFFSFFFHPHKLQVQHILTYSFRLESLNTSNVLTAWSDIPITCDIRIFWQKLANFYVASEYFPTWNVNNINVVFSSLFPTITLFDPVVGQIFLEFGLNFRQGLLDPSHMIFHLFLTNSKKKFI